MGSVGPIGGIGGKHEELFDDGQELADRQINIRNRFRRADQRGQYEFFLAGEAVVPVRNYEARVLALAKGVPVTQDFFVTAVGQLCMDGFGGCSIQIIANLGGVNEIVLANKEYKCNVGLAGWGQGNITADLQVIKGCDAQNVFPKRFIANFVLEENGEGDMMVQGCTNGTEAVCDDPYSGLCAEYPAAKFRCAADRGADDSHGYYGSSEADKKYGEEDPNDRLTPISLFGNLNRQEGVVERVKNKHKDDKGGFKSTWMADEVSRRENEFCEAFPCPILAVQPACCENGYTMSACPAGACANKKSWKYD